MANIMITNVCNLNCSYCFANEFVNSQGIQHITLENYKRILDFIETAKDDEHIGLIGGEPTLHPQFKEILQIASERAGVKSVIVFTNGILLDRYFSQFNDPKMNILINCNSPQMIGKSNYEHMHENIRQAVRDFHLKDQISLGLNIYEEDQNVDFIFELLEEFGFDKLRISLVVPNEKVSGSPLPHFRQMKPTVMSIIIRALKKGIVPYFDCNKLPVCMLTDEERQTLLQLCNHQQISNILSEYSNCEPVLDILQDLTAVRCFGLSDVLKVNIEGFETIEDLRQFFVGQIDVFAHTVTYDEKCKNCYERLCRKCSGGCLAYKIDEIKKYSEFSF